MEIFRSRLPSPFELPKQIVRLGELAYNLWWTWHPEAVRLFGRIDYDLWERLGHNPIVYLRELRRTRLKRAADNKDYLSQYDNVMNEFDEYFTRFNGMTSNGSTPTPFARLAQALHFGSQVTTPVEKDWTIQNYPEIANQPIAYFSMEFGLHETLPIYGGGLGILAGDHLKESSDLGLPLVGVGLMYSQGYFSQQIDENGKQEELNNPLIFEDTPALRVCSEEDEWMTVEVELPGRTVSLGLWEIRVGRVPLYLLDSDLEANSEEDRKLTTRLYFSESDLRIKQEMLLGIGGVRALRAIGYNPSVWHMNEGHAAFLILERTREVIKGGTSFEEALSSIRQQNIFTTHTPVPAGNDEFPPELLLSHLSDFWPQLNVTSDELIKVGSRPDEGSEKFSMGILALRNSGGRNAVSELHGRVSREMWHFLWPDKPVDKVPITHVTNGVHSANWMARRFQNLFSKFLGGDWYEHLDETGLWSKLDDIPDADLWDVHLHLKRKLAFYMRERVRDRWMEGGFHPVQVVTSGVLINPYALTIGFARRFATYKRANLILRDVERLINIINQPNMPVQILFAGKAHPADGPGKELILQIYQQLKRAETGGRIVFLEDYDMNLARYLVQGVDVWLNTPRRPLEASGTSGMKAAMNGALNFSVLDGWWREAYNGRNGWAIGEEKEYSNVDEQDTSDAESLYSILEKEIIPGYYDMDQKAVPGKWVRRMKNSMRTIIPAYSTRRMVKEYVERLYVPAVKS